MNRLLSAASIVILCLSLIGCGEPESQVDDPIATALGKLKTRANDDAFVIIEALPSENYVQFSTYGNQTVFVSFPVSIYEPEDDSFGGIVETEIVDEIPEMEGFKLTRFLSEEEEARVKKYLKSWEIDFEIHAEKGVSPEGKMERFFSDIEADFELEGAKHADFVHGVFTEVFGLSNYTINIIEN